MRTAAAIVVASVCALLAGCGSIGEPLYPALKLPARVTDLAVVERGPNLVFDFTIAPLTTEGLPLKEIGSIDLRVGPNQPNGWNLEEWLKTSSRVNVPMPYKPGAVHAEFPASGFVGREVVAAVLVTNAKGKDAGWSNLNTFTVEPPLATPADFRAEPTAKGVELNWREPGVSEFRVYRKAEPEQRPMLLATATEQNYLDISAEYGKTYEYSVQAVRGKVESDAAGPQTVTPKDVFPPAVPIGLTASAGLGAIELAWTRNTEPDFKEYRVLRSEEGAPFVQIAAGLDAPTYSDHAIQTGKHYRYQVIAVDQNGNPSAPSAPVEITAP
jgi:hypothetical protein